MNRYVKFIWLIATASMVIAVTVPSAEAAVPVGSSAAAVFPNEGNVNCSDYAGNKVIESMDTSKAVYNVSTLLTGPEDPTETADSDADTSESAHYLITPDGKTATFSVDSDAAINYAVLKSNTDVAVYIYNSGGVGSDHGMQIIRNGTAEPITALSLCYGLPDQTMVEEDLPSCSSLGIDVSTSSDTNSQVIARFDIDKDTGQKLNATLCQAYLKPGDAPFHRCDPNLPYNSTYACYNDNTSPNKQDPATVNFGGDTSNIGGSAGYFTNTWPPL